MWRNTQWITWWQPLSSDIPQFSHHLSFCFCSTCLQLTLLLLTITFINSLSWNKLTVTDEQFGVEVTLDAYIGGVLSESQPGKQLFVSQTVLVTDPFWLRKVIMDPHTLAHVDMECPDIRHPKIKMYISEPILDSHKYRSAAYVKRHCIIWP